MNKIFYLIVTIVALALGYVLFFVSGLGPQLVSNEDSILCNNGHVWTNLRDDPRGFYGPVQEVSIWRCVDVETYCSLRGKHEVNNTISCIDELCTWAPVGSISPCMPMTGFDADRLKTEYPLINFNRKRTDDNTPPAPPQTTPPTGASVSEQQALDIITQRGFNTSDTTSDTTFWDFELLYRTTPQYGDKTPNRLGITGPYWEAVYTNYNGGCFNYKILYIDAVTSVFYDAGEQRGDCF